jgi:L-cysteine:1D-myo-inositol 2-amino-2-deoxy-alpha-D-glucopyranoside ligase
MVGLDGEKMSKSRGNLVLVSRLREQGLDPMVVRLLLLGHHYRSDWEWQESDVSAAGARLDKWRDAVARPAGAPTPELVGQVLASLADDLRAPDALRAIDHWADATGFGADDEAGAGDVVRRLVDAALGLAL